MRTVGELLRPLTLPAAPVSPAALPYVPTYTLPAVHLLGADLPQGHLHVWSGPRGGGKTAFLLGLLHSAASRGRPAVLATYDLPAATLALRLLAMESGVPLSGLETQTLSAADAAAASRARARLSSIPLYLLEARGLTVDSLEDRCARAPRRIDVVGVDFVEAVVRQGDEPMSAAFRDLSALAHRRWVAVVAIARASPSERLATGAAALVNPVGLADRIGWIDTPSITDAGNTVGPAGSPGSANAPGTSVAMLLANRHGPRASAALRLDAACGRWVDADGT